MIVSWDWLKQYVPLEMAPSELEERLTACGLNHEGSRTVGKDLAIDLEVTSNRPDCLGHLGVAREIAVLYDLPLTVPIAEPVTGPRIRTEEVSVELEAADLCPRYTGRVIRGVKVGPSPEWLVDRLRTIYEYKQGARWEPVNNVVDITNYVLLESGQPLHAFDLDHVAGHKIVVRRAVEGEQLIAINHKTYTLDSDMCVIADQKRPIALGGIMGGAETEVSSETTDLFIESAMFAPLSIRSAARKLALFSDSSYRFERGPDPKGVDWASRRCCELILQVAGGELAEGTIDLGTQAESMAPIPLRLSEIERILGIVISPAQVERILIALGNNVEKKNGETLTIVPPSWRQDLSREVDLIEEVARIDGYDKIPEDRQVPICASSRSRLDRVTDRVYHTLTSAGFDEVITPSAVDAQLASRMSPWSTQAPLQSKVPMLRGANQLRTSLIPSLLNVRRTNENVGVETIEIFELASVYLATPNMESEAWHTERKLLGLCSGRGFFELKGVVEALLVKLGIGSTLDLSDCADPFFRSGHAADLQLKGERLGYIGEVSDEARKTCGLRTPVFVAELCFSRLVNLALLIPSAHPLSPYPTVDRDFNFEVGETVRWSDFAATVRQAAGEHLESIEHLETYRDQERLGEGRKSLVLKVVLRKADGTLTGDEAEQVSQQISTACHKAYGASLRT
ncbi:MAG: phenylalanine--tRNA ligase subunit beta [Planctomycetota bacterium]|nr:phenylalanine--tRNA ligase subunit beta [Planctomycetota bacterium]